MRNITPKDHANKFYFWEINDCNNINSYPNNYAYIEASQENE
ncbi:MAG: hypothetical protein P1U46_03715 [Patescibacteria group bacterium]|nr:hypothetical protein [Patescibacteria group bacterium]